MATSLGTPPGRPPPSPKTPPGPPPKTPVKAKSASSPFEPKAPGLGEERNPPEPSGPPPGWKPPEPAGPPAIRSRSINFRFKNALNAEGCAQLGAGGHGWRGQSKDSRGGESLGKEIHKGIPHITNDNLNDASFHDSRYHADVAKGTPHNVAWRDERQRRRAIVHRRVGVKGRALEKLDRQWHERRYSPESVHGIHRIDEDNLDVGIETVIVGTTGETTMTPFGQAERKMRKDFMQFPDDEHNLLRSDPQKNQKIAKQKRVRSTEYKQKGTVPRTRHER